MTLIIVKGLLTGTTCIFQSSSIPSSLPVGTSRYLSTAHTNNCTLVPVSIQEPSALCLLKCGIRYFTLVISYSRRYILQYKVVVLPGVMLATCPVASKYI